MLHPIVRSLVSLILWPKRLREETTLVKWKQVCVRLVHSYVNGAGKASARTCRYKEAPRSMLRRAMSLFEQRYRYGAVFSSLSHGAEENLPLPCKHGAYVTDRLPAH